MGLNERGTPAESREPLPNRSTCARSRRVELIELKCAYPRAYHA
jgi:hypothetical protein